MRAVYVSSLLSEAAFAGCFPDPGKSPGQAVQKYHRLLARGLARNGAEVIALSAPPVTRRNTRARFVRLRPDTEEGVRFSYLPVLLVPVLKHLVTLFTAFFRTLRFVTRDSFVICDTLNVTVSAGARAAAFLRRTPCIGIVTDVPDMMSEHPSRINRINRRLLAGYDAYLFLTEQMNSLINKRGRPYLVAEGQVDAALGETPPSPVEKDDPPVLLYAGMLHERYGILRLAQAFAMTRLPARLVIYGTGDAEDRLRGIAAKDPRIRLMGQRDNAEVVAHERRAALLINPRPSDAEFTKYSFPSKNMEYMASGTPVLTTRLPGMPEEYRDHVYLFDGEQPEEMAAALTRVMGEGAAALAQRGAAARAFVLQNKTNVRQAARLIAFAAALTGKAGKRHGAG